MLLLPKTGPSQRNAISDRNVTIGQFLSKLDCGSFSFNPDLVGSTVTQTTTVRDVADLARLTIADGDVSKVTEEFNQTLALLRHSPL